MKFKTRIRILRNIGESAMIGTEIERVEFIEEVVEADSGLAAMQKLMAKHADKGVAVSAHGAVPMPADPKKRKPKTQAVESPLEGIKRLTPDEPPKVEGQK